MHGTRTLRYCFNEILSAMLSTLQNIRIFMKLIHIVVDFQKSNIMTSVEDRNEMQFVLSVIYKDPEDSYYTIRYFIK